MVDLFPLAGILFTQAYSIISEENLQVKGKEIFYSNFTPENMALRKVGFLALEIC